METVGWEGGWKDGWEGGWVSGLAWVGQWVCMGGWVDAKLYEWVCMWTASAMHVPTFFPSTQAKSWGDPAE